MRTDSNLFSAKWVQICSMNEFDLYNVDDVSKQLTAIKILAECLAKGKQSICYFYEEDAVSVMKCISSYMCLCEDVAHGF